MALDPLAAVADLEARGLTVEASETALVETYLDVASTAVREAAGVPISQTTSTITLEGEEGQRLTLPGLPVVSVASVELDGEPLTDWRLRTGRLWRAAGWTACDGPSEVEVTYTHGMAVVPADIVDLVCRMVAAALKSARAEEDGTGIAADRVVTSERLGDWAVTYASDGRLTEMDLPQHWRERLAARFGGGVSSLRSR
ncbi:hypothetical protein [Streptomyces pacificus]|uniref:Uncharacterized protein n=1 Tax=Streptomyces pacificus TaxID=2705029 RepID=A0A6A0B2Y8_9ACTN|nr:hypothetical protein [Streptomyces pacificus]GFH38911.1 hypothetical protein SCWH03_51740 [Streptomyces pacificus]